MPLSIFTHIFCVKKMNNKIIFLIVCATLWVACSESGTDAKPFDASVVCPENARGTFVDERDGQVYKYTTIGDQVWMAQNLNYEFDGASIYNPLRQEMTTARSTCLYEGDDCAEKGRVYGWVSAYNACPAGWHLPSREEWNRLIDNMGGREEAGVRLKSREGWLPLNAGESSNGSDDCGFDMVSAKNEVTSRDGFFVYLWTTSESCLNLSESNSDAVVEDCSHFSTWKGSVRCIRD